MIATLVNFEFPLILLVIYNNVRRHIPSRITSMDHFIGINFTKSRFYAGDKTLA
jgi:hypothetical protein